ncbi:MAG: hypothetical protein AAGH40_08090 [Verrucomicrobiota bacterium]
MTELREHSSVSIVRLDRTRYKKQTIKQAAEHQAIYHSMSAKECGESFQYLMRVSYGFLGQEWPKMDKTAFSKRTLQ